MDEAVTLFTNVDGLTRVVAGPEPLAEARQRLAQAMTDKKAPPGIMEIWSRRGVTDRFIFREDKEASEEMTETSEAFEE